jgi:hypothetical protein
LLDNPEEAGIESQDGVRDIVLGRGPMSDFDGLVKEWKSSAGDSIRKEYLDATAAAR